MGLFVFIRILIYAIINQKSKSGDRMASQNLNYKNSSIKLTIPVLTVEDKVIRIDFNILMNAGHLQNVAIQSCELIFSSGEIIKSDSTFIISNTNREKVSMTVSFVKQFLKNDLKIRITCLTKIDKLTVEYTRKSTGETSLYNISLSKMTAGDKVLYQKIETKSIDKKSMRKNRNMRLQMKMQNLNTQFLMPNGIKATH